MNNYKIINGDCIPGMHKLASQGVKFDLSIFSPPFSSLYTYSESNADASNSKSLEEFWLWTRFFASSLEKVMKDGRMVCVHIQDSALTISQNGKQGIYDFSGDFIRLMQEFDFTYWCPITIYKNAAQVVSNSPSAVPPLQFGTLKRNSLKVRTALVDRILVFKKNGESEVPVRPVENGDMDFDTWCAWADGVWMDLKPTDITRTQSRSGSKVRAYTLGKGEGDVKHMTPTQREVYRRCMLMWSNPNESIIDPFGGCGTCAEVGLKNKRNTTLCELKGSYADLSELVSSRTKSEINYLQRQPKLFV